VLTGAAAALILGMHWNTAIPRHRLAGLDWLRSCGRLSYEIYLTHMFCVFGVVAVARWSALDPAWGWIWYAPAIAASWLLGWIVARCFSQPCERRLQSYWLHPAAPRRETAIAAPADV